MTVYDCDKFNRAIVRTFWHFSHKSGDYKSKRCVKSLPSPGRYTHLSTLNLQYSGSQRRIAVPLEEFSSLSIFPCARVKFQK